MDKERMDKATYGERESVAHADQLRRPRRPYQFHQTYRPQRPYPPYQPPPSRRARSLPPLEPQLQPHLQLPVHKEPVVRKEPRPDQGQQPATFISYTRYPLEQQAVPVRGPRLAPRKLKKHRKPLRPRHKWMRGLFVACCVVMLVAVLLFSQGNSQTGAWFADTFRAILGRPITAQIESWYLSFNDVIHQTQYQLNGKKVDAPWKVGPTPTVHVLPNTLTHPGTPRVVAMDLTQISPMVTPALGGEGSWITQENAPSPYNYLPIAAKTFLRPDTSHPYAIVTLLKFDSRFISLHMVAGTTEPGGPVGVPGPGVIPSADQNSNALLAAFNGGFKYSDGQYGMKADGTLYVPPQAGAATIAVTKKGRLSWEPGMWTRASTAAILTW